MYINIKIRILRPCFRIYIILHKYFLGTRQKCVKQRFCGKRETKLHGCVTLQHFPNLSYYCKDILAFFNNYYLLYKLHVQCDRHVGILATEKCCTRTHVLISIFSLSINQSIFSMSFVISTPKQL